MTYRRPIPVVDIFAGAGGLGDGFEAYGRGQDRHGAYVVSLSAEKDPSAVRTLTTRAFFRSFAASEVPRSYYDYVAGRVVRPWTVDTEKVWRQAERRACRLELGNPEHDAVLDARIAEIAREAARNDLPWVLVGGPPCQAYSLVGRSRNRGNKAYDPKADERYRLYKHYLKILSRHRPAAFVLENVKGMLTAEIEGINVFKEIYESLHLPGGRNGPRYRIVPLVRPKEDGGAGLAPKDFVVRSENFGIPQARHRVILVGLLEEIGKPVGELVPCHERLTVRQMIGGLPEIRSGLTDGSIVRWSAFAPKLLRECARYAKAVDQDTAKQLKLVASCADAGEELDAGGSWVPMRYVARLPAHLDGFMRDARLHGAAQHKAREHMRSDLMRYAYASAFAHVHGRSPKGMNEFPVELYPAHKSWTKPNKFIDRFKVQRAESPSSTITSHLEKDGHYFIHYDTRQIRSLTVREAARLQTFPDNYFFEGPAGAQRRQVGNAVPPWLGYQIAGALLEALR